jgi:hypothetical protein
LPEQRGFTSPQFFEPATKSAFPRDTRPLAIVGLIGYGAYLAGNALRNR